MKEADEATIEKMTGVVPEMARPLMLGRDGCSAYFFFPETFYASGWCNFTILCAAAQSDVASTDVPLFHIQERPPSF